MATRPTVGNEPLSSSGSPVSTLLKAWLVTSSSTSRVVVVLVCVSPSSTGPVGPGPVGSGVGSGSVGSGLVGSGVGSGAVGSGGVGSDGG